MTEITHPHEATNTTVETDLLAFLETRTRTRWRPDQDLFASGVVSSLFAMELVGFVETAFGVTVSGPDLVLENFRSVHAMTDLVRRLWAERDGV